MIFQMVYFIEKNKVKYFHKKKLRAEINLEGTDK
jgi:hypothetical protein